MIINSKFVNFFVKVKKNYKVFFLGFFLIKIVILLINLIINKYFFFPTFLKVISYKIRKILIIKKNFKKFL